MMSPFDSKNRVATALDRLALRVLLFFLSVGYFFALWHSGAPSLLAGSALFALAMLTLLLLERRTLALAPAQQGRYLLVAFLLALLYLFLRSLLSLVFALTAFVLAMLCARENRKAFRL